MTGDMRYSWSLILLLCVQLEISFSQCVIEHGACAFQATCSVSDCVNRGAILVFPDVNTSLRVADLLLEISGNSSQWITLDFQGRTLLPAQTGQPELTFRLRYARVINMELSGVRVKATGSDFEMAHIGFQSMESQQFCLFFEAIQMSVSNVSLLQAENGMILQKSANIELSDLHFQGHRKDGIQVFNTTQVSIERSSFRGMYQAILIGLDSSDVTVSQSNFSDNSFSINLQGANSHIDMCQFQAKSSNRTTASLLVQGSNNSVTSSTFTIPINSEFVRLWLHVYLTESAHSNIIGKKGQGNMFEGALNVIRNLGVMTTILSNQIVVLEDTTSVWSSTFLYMSQNTFSCLNNSASSSYLFLNGSGSLVESNVFNCTLSPAFLSIVGQALTHTEYFELVNNTFYFQGGPVLIVSADVITFVSGNRFYQSSTSVARSYTIQATTGVLLVGEAENGNVFDSEMAVSCTSTCRLSSVINNKFLSLSIPSSTKTLIQASSSVIQTLSPVLVRGNSFEAANSVQLLLQNMSAIIEDNTFVSSSSSRVLMSSDCSTCNETIIQRNIFRGSSNATVIQSKTRYYMSCFKRISNTTSSSGCYSLTINSAPCHQLRLYCQTAMFICPRIQDWRRFQSSMQLPH